MERVTTDELREAAARSLYTEGDDTMTTYRLLKRTADTLDDLDKDLAALQEQVDSARAPAGYNDYNDPDDYEY